MRDISHQMVRRYFARGGSSSIHDALDGLAVAHAVHKTADAADALRYIDIFLEVLFFHQLFKAPVDKTDGGDRLDDRLVLEQQDPGGSGSGRTGCWGPKGTMTALRH